MLNSKEYGQCQLVGHCESECILTTECIISKAEEKAAFPHTYKDYQIINILRMGHITYILYTFGLCGVDS